MKMPFAVWALIVIVLLALGVYRLELGRTPGDWGGLPALREGSCTPSVDVPTGMAVNIGSAEILHASGHPTPPNASTQQQGAPGTSTSIPALTFRTTGTLEVRVAQPLPTEGKEVTLADQELVLTKASGSFAMTLDGQTPAFVQRGNAALRVAGPARFGPADDAEYVLKVPANSQLRAVVTGGKAMVNTGEVLAKVPLTTTHSVVPLQPLRGGIWIGNPVPTLSPLRAAGRAGLEDLSVESGRTAPAGDQANVANYACALRTSRGKVVGTWEPAGIVSPPTGSINSSRLTITLPESAVPADSSLLSSVWIALGTADGRKLAIGGAKYVGRLWAGAIGTLLTLILLGAIMYARGQRKRGAQNKPRWFAGMFIGPDGDPSLSLLQIFIWTTITLWGFFYVFIVAGDLLALTPEMMSLLGIAGTGSVLARLIAVSRGGSTSLSASPSTAASTSTEQSGNDFWKLLSTNGQFDLLKLQLFAFTVVIAMYVVWRIADAAAFPSLDTNTLLLLGVSQGVYVASKLAGTSDLAALQSAKAQLELASTESKNLAGQKVALEKQLADANATAPVDAALVAKLQASLDVLAIRIVESTKSVDALKSAYDAGLAKLGLKQA